MLQKRCDDDSVAMPTDLAAEGARVFAVLRDFHLLDELTQRRTVARPVLANDANLLRALRLQQSVTSR